MKVVWQESAKVGRREVAAYIRKEFGIKNKITQEYVIKVEIERFPPFSFVFHFFFVILQDYYGEEATNRRRLLLQRK